jgi:hypothetical protein
LLHTRLDHLADGCAVQRLVNLEGGHVRLDVVHPAAHVRVHRHDGVADKDLAVVEIG